MYTIEKELEKWVLHIESKKKKKKNVVKKFNYCQIMQKCFACKIKYRNQLLFQINDDKVTIYFLFKKKKNFSFVSLISGNLYYLDKKF